MTKTKFYIEIIALVLAACFLAFFLWHDFRTLPTRRKLFAELRPTAITNCEVKRFGHPNDGGYLMCANLLRNAQAAYSYGIEGRDDWGCEISQDFGIPVHQYDCFDLSRPSCKGGQLIFHEECLGGYYHQDNDGRIFDSLSSQLTKNNDSNHSLVVKMDIEGSEWEALYKTPEEILNQITQLSVELHDLDDLRLNDYKFLQTIQKLKKVFYVAYVHATNYACTPFATIPFPAKTIEVLFVNKRLVSVDKNNTIQEQFNSLATPNDPAQSDCQIHWD